MQIHYQENLALVVCFDLFGKEVEEAKTCLNFLIKFSKNEESVECFKNYLRQVEASQRKSH